MGGSVTILNEDEANHSGDLLVKTSQLTATEIGGAIIPRLIDELPIIALLLLRLLARQSFEMQKN